MKDRLGKLLAAREARKAELVRLAESCQEVEELRRMNAEMDVLNGEITELRSMIEAAEPTLRPEELRTAMVNGTVPAVVLSSRRGEDRKSVNEEVEERGAALRENRTVQVSSSDLILPSHSSPIIRPNFNEVSSLLDLVSIDNLPGGESYSVPYEVSTGIGDYTAEGADYHTAEPTFGYAAIKKTKLTAYAEVTEEVLKLPNADYARKVEGGVRSALRKKITKEILAGDGNDGHFTGIFKSTVIDGGSDLEIATINEDTLDEIIFSYGGDEDVEDYAVLILSKLDLKAFSKVKNGKGLKAYEIEHNGNRGYINGVPWIINSVCEPVSGAGTLAGKFCMAYGVFSAYTIGVFSPIELARSSDYKFKQGMVAYRGSVFTGGNVTRRNGFLRIKKSA